jgi:hypothetical protein
MGKRLCEKNGCGWPKSLHLDGICPGGTTPKTFEEIEQKEVELELFWQTWCLDDGVFVRRDQNGTLR